MRNTLSADAVLGIKVYVVAQARGELFVVMEHLHRHVDVKHP